MSKKWKAEYADDGSGSWWVRKTAVGDFSLEEAFDGTWMLVWFPMDIGDETVIAAALESKAACKRRFRKFLRNLARQLRAELGG